MPVGGELLGQGGAHLARSHDDDFHVRLLKPAGEEAPDLIQDNKLIIADYIRILQKREVPFRENFRIFHRYPPVLRLPFVLSQEILRFFFEHFVSF